MKFILINQYCNEKFTEIYIFSPITENVLLYYINEIFTSLEKCIISNIAIIKKLFNSKKTRLYAKDTINNVNGAKFADFSVTKHLLPLLIWRIFKSLELLKGLI